MEAKGEKVMATKIKVKIKSDQPEVIGPVMESLGMPPNPAESLRVGALPQRRSPNQVISRPMERPVRLHRDENPHSSPETAHLPTPEGCGPDPEAHAWGEDKNKYSHGPNEEVTEFGGRIYGS